MDSHGTATISKQHRKQAVDFAMEQVGKQYVFGNAGPDTWDCSGLAMVAWQQAEVELAHYTVTMAGGPGDFVHGKVAGSVTEWLPATKRNRHMLLPGDLVFYYGVRAPEHVAMIQKITDTTDDEGTVIGHRWWIVQATDEEHGVESDLRMHVYGYPSGFGLIR